MSAHQAKGLADLRAYLVAEETALHALVGTRIRGVRLAQGEARPAIVFYVISASVEHYNGDGAVCDLDMTRVQFDIHADSYLEALQVRDALDDRLHAIGHTVQGHTILGTAQRDNERDASHVETLNLWVKTVDYLIAIQPSTT